MHPHGRFLNVTLAAHVALFCVIWAIALPGNLKAIDGIAPGAGQVDPSPPRWWVWRSV